MLQVKTTLGTETINEYQHVYGNDQFLIIVISDNVVKSYNMRNLISYTEIGVGENE